MHVYITPEEYEAAAARGISRKTLNLRVRIYGWPKDRALKRCQLLHVRHPRTKRLAAGAGGDR